MTTISGLDLEKKFIIIKEKAAGVGKELFERVFFATGGFGCKPNSLGTKVYGTYIDNGISGYVRRVDVERLATIEEVNSAYEFWDDNPQEPKMGGFFEPDVKNPSEYKKYLEATITE